MTEAEKLEIFDIDPTNRWRCSCVGEWERRGTTNPECPVHAHFCGCCGNQIIHDPSADSEPQWCLRCLNHITADGLPHDRTYFAQHGADCPYQV